MKYAKNKFGVKTLLILVIVFVSIQVFFTVQQGAMGITVAKYQEESERVLKDKSWFEEELVKSDSLAQMQKQAEGLGYKKADNIFYVKVNDQFAKASMSTD